MKKFASATVLSLLLAIAVSAQDAKPVQKPTPPDDRDVVKISTSVVQLDVTVLDSKGKAIADLRPDEIEIYENGEKQKITGLTFVSASRNAGEKTAAVDKDGVPAPPTVLTASQIRRTIALVVDDLSLSFESVYHTRRALKKFVGEQMQEGDLVAILRVGAGIGALQQFTADKRLLYAAIDKVKYNAGGAGGISAFAPIASDALPDDDGMETDPNDTAPADSSRLQSLDDFREAAFATGTLGALRYIVTGMHDLPGRKSVILFSDGFRLFETDPSGFKEASRTLEFARRLIDAATRSSVVFYTIDARGLAFTGLTAADNPSNNRPDSIRGARLLDSQEGLTYLARETGGFDVKNNNDLSGGVRRVLEDQSYYLVAYEPDSDTFDAAKRKYNEIKINITRAGAKVRYRSGFFNVADRAAPRAMVTLTPVGRLESALVSPFGVTDISLRLNALFGHDTKTGAYVRSLLHIDAADLNFTDQPDGSKKAVFDVLAMSFGDNGQPVDQIAKGYTMTLKPNRHKRLVEEGFVYHFIFPVKKPGAYQYRVAIRDFQSGKLGSASQFIEVPNLEKTGLTVSSIVLESLTADEWRRSANQTIARANPMSDTALRRVKKGSVLRFGFEVYNAKMRPAKQPGLKVQVRIFRDNKLILDGKPTPVELLGQTDLQHLKTVRAIALGEKMQPGDYILQVVVTDEFAKAKQRIATQFVQFEVVE